jgi:chromosomal replication initiation ATPase DnaA
MKTINREQIKQWRPVVQRIIAATATVMRVSESAMLGPERLRTYTQARRMAMLVTRAYTTLSYPEMAVEFRRDHSTVLEGVQRTPINAETLRAIRQIAEIARLGAVTRPETLTKDLAHE